VPRQTESDINRKRTSEDAGLEAGKDDLNDMVVSPLKKPSPEVEEEQKNEIGARKKLDMSNVVIL
jgi:hypothetical protein